MIWLLLVLFLCNINIQASPASMGLLDTCKQKKILLDYKSEDLIIIANKIAALKDINIMFPQDEKFSVKLTYSNKHAITVNEAWNFILTILDIAGYNGVLKNGIYQVVKNTDSLKEPFEVYVNTDPDKLSDSSQKIRYLYNFENLTIAAGSTIFTNLDQMLKEMLISGTEGNYLLDPATNSLLITNRSADIKAVMNIITELDKTGIREVIEVIPLLHTKPDYISKIVAQLASSPKEQKFGFFPQKQNPGLYFSENLKVLPIDRINSVAILGPKNSVNNVKNLIVKYLDRPIDSAKSTIHVRALDYIDSNDIAPVIQNLVKGKLPFAQAQVKDELANSIIITEQQVTTDALKPTESGDPTANTGTDPIPGEDATSNNKQQLASGSNSLIVSARDKDWLELKNLIDQLDTQPLQVAVDILIVELNLNFNKNLGAQTRNINNSAGEPQTLNYQNAMAPSTIERTNSTVAAPVLNFNSDGTINSVRGLAADLLAPVQNESSGASAISNLATNLALGSFMASYQDSNGVAYFLAGLDRRKDSQIMYHAYSYIKNGQKATLSSTVERFFPGEAQAQMAGSFRIVNKPIKATISIDILPTISKTETITMDVKVSANVFDTVIPDQVNKRELSVKTSVNNKEVLVIGGLMTLTDSITVYETPILSKIPILGTFFRNVQYNKEKNPIYIFILPTIIRPKMHGGYNAYTENKINTLRHNLNFSEECLLGSNFTRLKDPITKFFLPTGYNEINNKIDNFIGEKEINSQDPNLGNKIDKIKQNLLDDDSLALLKDSKKN
ncbi:MAG: hypothetical protein P4L22_04575 [Candidatus Babeliales bacterium]|nr:hypothetical protein [Candidatus Babeliales bacterium]